MVISDLNYLENSLEEIFGGRGTNINNASAYLCDTLLAFVDKQLSPFPVRRD
jgi:hypothetical protein